MIIDSIVESRFTLARQRFVAALADEANLRPGDDAVVAGSVRRSVDVLDEIRAARAAQPPPPIDDPIVIIGMLRTGTTLLDNLLALHPRLHGPQLWELADPVVAGGDPAGYPAAVEQAQSYVDDYNAKSPDFAAIHYLQADRPDECHRLLANTFHSMVLEMRYRVPSYGAWLHGQDQRLPYLEHRRQLEVLMRRRVDADGRPLTPVLKCPFHTWFLPALVHAYPRVRLVHLHRDPVEAIASTASLCRAVRSARTDHLDLPEIGAQWADRIVPLTQRLADDRDGLAGDRPVLDIRYQDLAADPVAVVSRVCRELDLDAGPDFLAAVRNYLASNGQHRRGVHRYTPEEFGLDRAALTRATAGYTHRFGL